MSNIFFISKELGKLRLVDYYFYNTSYNTSWNYNIIIIEIIFKHCYYCQKYFFNLYLKFLLK